MARDIRPDADPSHSFSGLSLSDYMVACGQSDPRHLQPVVDVFADVLAGKRLRCVIAAPRQHGKSTLVLHAIPWLLLASSKIQVAYATYGQQFSGKQSRVARAIATRTGVKLSADHNTIQEWRTEQNGGCLATSIDGPLTGYTVRVGIVDDPFKGRAEAESLEQRELAHAWLKGDLMGCVGPKGSILIVASRYHEDDLSGRCIAEGFDEIRIPAICDDEENDPLGRELGAPLCPWGPDPEEPRDLEFLRSKELEVGPYDWASLYQGKPRPRSGAIFRDVHFYNELPPLRRIVVGFDLAYSASGDRIAVVVLGESDLMVPIGYDERTKQPVMVPVLYVLHVWTQRKSAIEAHEEIRAQVMPWRDCPMASYVIQAERGALTALATHDDPSKRIIVHALPAKQSKLVRAARTARRWNAGAIRVPRGVPWADDFARVICGFTGLPGGRDDEADALVSAHDMMTIGETFRTAGGGFKAGRRIM